MELSWRRVSQGQDQDSLLVKRRNDNHSPGPVIRELVPSSHQRSGERGGSVVECRTPEREVGGSKPTATMLCPWARHFTPRKYWLITQEAVAPSRHDWKIVDWDVKPQHNQPTHQRSELSNTILCIFSGWDQRIGEGIPIPDSLGEEATFICIRSYLYWQWESEMP